MSNQYIIAGTDTNIGKTVLSAMFMSAFDELSYWKPIQSGLQEETDTEVVMRLSECSHERIIPEAYRLTQPLSPHLSARLDGIRIDADALVVPDRAPLIIEMAGGLLVPINERTLQTDLIRQWGLPVILAARSSLGTINHTLLSLEALRSRGIDVAGVVVIGEANIENERAIREYGRIGILGRIHRLSSLNKSALAQEFAREFSSSTFFQK